MHRPANPTSAPAHTRNPHFTAPTPATSLRTSATPRTTSQTRTSRHLPEPRRKPRRQLAQQAGHRNPRHRRRLLPRLRTETWGPVGKVVCGYAVGLALLAGGVWLERKATYRIFARGGIGGGWALTFFTTYAMHHMSAARVVHSLVLDLVLMLLVAAGMVAHSLRYSSQTVTGLAFGSASPPCSPAT